MASYFNQHFRLLGLLVLLPSSAAAHTHAILGVPSPGFVGQAVDLSLSCSPVPVPALSNLSTWVAIACLAVVGLVALSRLGRGATWGGLALLIGLSLISSSGVRSDDCDGSIDWSAESAAESFADTGLAFSFTPTMAGTFTVLAETNEGTTMASVTVCEAGETLGIGGVCEPPPLLDYVGATHDADDCSAAGGMVVPLAGDPNGTETCQFIQSNCPAGWAGSSNWSTTIGSNTPWSMNHASFSTTCNGVPFIWPDVVASGSLPSGSHAWSNVSQEAEVCSLWNGPPVIQVIGNCSDPLIDQVAALSVSPPNPCGGISTESAIVFSNGGVGTLSRWVRTTSPVFANASTTHRGCH